MKAHAVIKACRFRLNDAQERTFSDEFLLNALQEQRNFLAFYFNQGAKHEAKELSPRDNSLILQRVSLKIIKAFLNGKEIAQKGIESALSARKELSFVCLNNQVFSIEPKSAARGLAEVFYIPAYEVASLDSELYLDGIFLEALILGVLKTAHTLPVLQDALQRVQLFDALYARELEKISAIINANNSSSVVLTSFKSV